MKRPPSCWWCAAVSLVDCGFRRLTLLFMLLGTNQKLVRAEGGLPSVVELLLQTQNSHLQLEAAGTLAVLAHDRTLFSSLLFSPHTHTHTRV